MIQIAFGSARVFSDNITQAAGHFAFAVEKYLYKLIAFPFGSLHFSDQSVHLRASGKRSHSAKKGRTRFLPQLRQKTRDARFRSYA